MLLFFPHTTSNSLIAAPSAAVVSSIQAYITFLQLHHDSTLNYFSHFQPQAFSDARDTPAVLTIMWPGRARKLKPNETILDQLGLELMDNISLFFLGPKVLRFIS